MGIKKYITG